MELGRTSSAGSPTLTSKDFVSDVDNVTAVYSNYSIGKNTNPNPVYSNYSIGKNSECYSSCKLEIVSNATLLRAGLV